jgi:hypothetical protein
MIFDCSFDVPHAGVCTAAILLLALHLCSCASELNFASVPIVDDVPANQLAKFTSCIVDCALEPARIFFPFRGESCVGYCVDLLGCAQSNQLSQA